MIESFYTGERVNESAVLDVRALQQQLPEDQWQKARRTQPVYMWIAEPGDHITENPGTINMRQTVANGGEVVFIKKTGQELKVYIPADANGLMTKQDLDERYTVGEPYTPAYPADDEILSVVPKGREVLKRFPKAELHVAVLPESIKEATILLNARGEGKHQELVRGDSLKFEDGVVVGVPQKEFRTAWELVRQPGQSAQIA